MTEKRNILLFSTLNPYPFWAGSETFWFEFVSEPRVHNALDFHLVLADSPVTRQKGKQLEKFGVRSSFYKHFNVDFLRRNLYRIHDKVRSRPHRTLPWYNAIGKELPQLVWFCVSTTNELLDLAYAVEECRKHEIPYWISIQHSYEALFFNDSQTLETASDVATGARTIIFIAERNRQTLERAIGKQLGNVFRAHNTLPQKKIDAATNIAATHLAGQNASARFFNLGRFSSADKGQHLLVEALSRPQWLDRDWTLSFVGMNEFGKAYIERLSRYYDMPDGRLNFVSFTDQVFEEIAKYDVLLMPSLAEGTPYAMIESMAGGRPAMGTPVGGIPELISNGKNGWLARTSDISDIADALERMWGDRDMWHEMGCRAGKLITTEYVTEAHSEKLLAKMIEDTST